MNKDRMAALMRLAQQMNPSERMVSVQPVYGQSMLCRVLKDVRQYEIMREFNSRLHK